MSNAFDAANFPAREPASLTAGDRVMWKRTDLGADYPPALYSLRYSLRRDSAPAEPEIEILATASGSDFIIEVTAAVSGAWTPGRYVWQAYITRLSDSQRLTVGRGQFEINPNFNESNIDLRSHARRTLDSIEAAIEALSSTLNVKSYSLTIGGSSRSMTKRDVPELLVLRDRYRAEARDEERWQNGHSSNKIKAVL